MFPSPCTNMCECLLVSTGVILLVSGHSARPNSDLTCCLHEPTRAASVSPLPPPSSRRRERYRPSFLPLILQTPSNSASARLFLLGGLHSTPLCATSLESTPRPPQTG
ncbi:unnamed protein product [Protopolystoma xenopodis]|uniref:Secreted protein n=1 Tax=Protopolystoma xenopodis TaxID=117903 RepID=A0A448XS24_9PLAT|nr:unnamed protein product [Protopolystoma xenopodis]